MKNLLLYISPFLFVSCEFKVNEKQEEKNRPAQQMPLSNSEEYWQKSIDSVYSYMLHLMDTILTVAGHRVSEGNFSGEIDTSVYREHIQTIFQFGNLFSKDRKHLIVKRHVGLDLFSDIFLFGNNEFSKLVADTTDNGYYADTIMDINNDGFNDYIISSYSNSGCCPRNNESGYIYNHKKDSFNRVGFFNRESSIDGKLTYETDYGQPGLITFYKFKWVGVEKILVESLSPNQVEDSLFFFVMPYTFTKVNYQLKKKEIIREVPQEYRRLELFDYFIRYQVE